MSRFYTISGRTKEDGITDRRTKGLLDHIFEAPFADNLEVILTIVIIDLSKWETVGLSI